MQLNITRRGMLAASGMSLMRTRASRAQANPIRIGVLTDMTGPYRDNGGPTAVACVRQAIEDSGIVSRGIPIEVLVGDHQNKPDIGLSVARQWFDRDGVDVVAECNNSAIAFAVNDLVTAKDKVFVCSGAGSTDLTGSRCSPNMVQWQTDSWADAVSIADTVVKAGGTKWFFVVADYATGHILHEMTAREVVAAGGTVVGKGVYPFPDTTDFSSFLLQAQASGATAIAFCNAGVDLVHCVKQAHEFGMGKTKLVGVVTFLNNIRTIGLETAQGMLLTESFYWDLNDRTRSFMNRIKAKAPNTRPNAEQACSYGGVLHNLKAVEELGAARAKASGKDAVDVMKRMPTDDDCFGRGAIREDGRKLQPIYVFEAKTPAQSSNDWDLYKLVATVPADRAYRPLDPDACKFLKR